MNERVIQELKELSTQRMYWTGYGWSRDKAKAYRVIWLDDADKETEGATDENI